MYDVLFKLLAGWSVLLDYNRSLFFFFLHDVQGSRLRIGWVYFFLTIYPVHGSSYFFAVLILVIYFHSLNAFCRNSIWRNSFAGPSIDLLSPDDHRASSPPPSHLWSNITSSLIPFQPSKYYWKTFLPLGFYLHYAFICNSYVTDIHSACFLHYTVRM